MAQLIQRYRLGKQARREGHLKMMGIRGLGGIMRPTGCMKILAGCPT